MCNLFPPFLETEIDGRKPEKTRRTEVKNSNIRSLFYSKEEEIWNKLDNPRVEITN